MTVCRAALALVLGLVWARAALGAPAARSPQEELLATAAERLRAGAADPGSIAAVAVLAGLDEQVPNAALEAALGGGLVPTAHPLVAAQAAYLRGRLLDQLGRPGEAEEARAALGLFSRFSVIGPFGEGRASFRVAFPPEKEKAPPELGRTYRGKLRDVGWREATGAVVDGVLHLDGLLRPDNQAVAYAVTFVWSDRERPAALRLGSPGPVRVFLNGRMVFERDVVRPAALDQDAAGVRLARGWNRVVVKTAIADGGWRLFLRLTEPGGAPLVLQHRAVPPAIAGAIRPAGGGGPPVQTLDRLLERRANGARGGAAGALWLDYARYLAWASPHDRDRRAAARAFARAAEASDRSAAGEKTGAVKLAALLGAADAAGDDDERRRMLERALAIEDLPPGWRALITSRLAELARGQRREGQAVAGWRDALAIDPGCWPAALALAEEEGDAGLALTAVARLEALAPAIRALPRVRRTAARLYDAAGRRRDADRELEILSRERQVDVDVLHLLSARARARGDAKEAERRLAAASARRPDLPSLAIELARLQEGGSDPALRKAARATLETFVERMPDEPTALSALGKLLHRAGEGGPALEKLRGALALRPQDPELKRYVDRLAAGEMEDSVAHDELARRYAADARKLLPPSVAKGATSPNDGAVVLLDRRVVRVHPNGLSRTFAQRVVQVLTERGAEENKEFAVQYTPGKEEVELRHTRIYRRDAGGTLEILEATDRSDRDLSEPWYGLYYDNRAEIVRFETLRPGDVLEIQYLVDDVGSENQLADYFGDLQYLAETIPKKIWDYTLIAPASRPIYSNTPRLPQLERSVATEGDERIYRFAARDVAKIEGEPAMPGIGEVAPYLHLSTYASWNEVAAWYWRLVDEQLAPDDEIRRTARGLLRRKMDDAAKVRAAYDFVVTATRYVGLEFGIHGYKPYKVTQVLARRFGDCKDKAALLIALLREMGVESEMVLVRTRRGGRLEASPASLAAFDHAVVYVPKLNRYLDGTAEFSGATELPTQDQGVMVLRVGRQGGVLTETPVGPSRESRVERRWQIALAPSGEARIEERLTIRGQAAPNWRQHYQTAGERTERYGRAWNGRFPGARLTSVEMPEIENRNQPVRIAAEVTVPRFARSKPGGALEVPVSARDADFVRTYARLSTRRHDLVLAYPWQHDEELIYRIPTGWRVAEDGGAKARSVASPFGRFQLEVKVDGDTLRVHSSLDVLQVRVSPADYPRFRAFLAEIDTALEQPVVIAPQGGT